MAPADLREIRSPTTCLRTIQPQGSEGAWKDQAQELLIEVRALYLASKEPRTSLLPKLVAVLVSSYFASPIQLIPNWIPVIGYLDDLVVAIVGLRFARRRIPLGLMDKYLGQARAMKTDPKTLPNAAFALAVVGVFGLMTLVVWAIIHFLLG